MDTIKILHEYLDIGIDGDEEYIAIVASSLASRLKLLKTGIADVLLQSRAALLMDDMKGSSAALKQARKLKSEYHHFYAEWRRLIGEEENPDEDGDSDNEG